MKKYFILAILILSSMLISCIEYTEKMILNNNGSGEITFAVGLSEELLNFDDGKMQSNDFNEEKIKENYEGKEGIKVLGSRSYSKDGNRWIEVSLEFDSIENLQNASKDSSNNGMIGEMSLTENENGNWVFNRKISNDNNKEEDSDNSTNMMNMMFSKYEWQYELILPSKIISTNAKEEDVDTENKSVKWKFNLAGLSSNNVMTVVFEKHESTNNTAYVVVGAILLIALAAAALNLAKKKKPESV